MERSENLESCEGKRKTHMNKLLGRVGAVLGFLFLISVLDTVFSGYMEPKSLCRIFPGKTCFVSGKLSEERIPTVKDLIFTADSPLITVHYVEARGRMWRGKVYAAPSLDAGTYHFKTMLRWEKPAEEQSDYTVQVFDNEAAYRESFYSLFRRYFGVQPWAITAFIFPLLLLTLLAAFKASTRREASLNEAGLASVFKVTRCKEKCEISFSFGEEDGIEVGDSLRLMNRSWQTVGEAEVKKVGSGYATAEVDPQIPVKPNYLVAKRDR